MSGGGSNKPGNKAEGTRERARRRIFRILRRGLVIGCSQQQFESSKKEGVSLNKANKVGNFVRNVIALGLTLFCFSTAKFLLISYLKTEIGCRWRKILWMSFM